MAPPLHLAVLEAKLALERAEERWKRLDEAEPTEDGWLRVLVAEVAANEAYDELAAAWARWERWASRAVRS